MTLIFTAICQNGVFIRSDKRRKIINATGSIVCHDDMQKVYVSADRKIIIYNHGVNIIKGKSWRDFATNFSNDIRGKKINKLETALNIIENDYSAEIFDELSNNQLSKFCAFVVILKSNDKKWHAGEITWKHGKGTNKIFHGKIILSGSGSNYIKIGGKMWTNDYWSSIRTMEAKIKIAKLWDLAVEKQSKVHGDDFSSLYDDIIVS